jgi:hypothetical protein
MSEPITRTTMEKFDVPDSRYETVMMARVNRGTSFPARCMK